MRIFAAAALSVALCGLAPFHASAQNASIPRNENILVDYYEPHNPELLGDLDPTDPSKAVQEVFEKYRNLKRVHDRVKERKLLERFSQFLAPLKLPGTLRLFTKECGFVNAFYSPSENSITLCLEYVLARDQAAPKEPVAGISREDAIVGGIVTTLLHETGHAISHIFRVPVLGREEDSADQMAAFVMLQFGDRVAMTTVKGALWSWSRANIPLGMGTTSSVQRRVYSDSHSTNGQRFFTFLCMAYGDKPNVFQSYIDAGFIDKVRAANCRRDYEQTQRAFEKTVLPHVDRGLMAKVQSATWFYPEDMGQVPVQTR